MTKVQGETDDQHQKRMDSAVNDQLKKPYGSIRQVKVLPRRTIALLVRLSRQNSSARQLIPLSSIESGSAQLCQDVLSHQHLRIVGSQVFFNTTSKKYFVKQDPAQQGKGGGLLKGQTA